MRFFGNIQSAVYAYGNDGLTKDITDSVHANFSQKNDYDFAARLKKNDVGPTTGTHPFTQTMKYDAFSNLTDRSNTTWGNYSDSFTATYANNRKTSGVTID